MSFRRRALLAVAALAAILALSAALGFSPLARYLANSRAHRLGISLNIASLRPAWLGIRLSNVDILIPEIPALTIHIDQALVRPDGSAQIVHGNASFTGSPDDLRAQLKRWRDARPPPGSTTSSPRSAVSVAGFAITWTDPAEPASSFRVFGLSAPDALGTLAVHADRLELRHARGQLDASAVDLALERGETLQLRTFYADDVHAQVDLQAREATPADAEGLPNPSVPVDTTGTPVAVVPAKLKAWRANVFDLAAAASLRMAPDARVDVGALETKMTRGEEKLTLGPGRLEVFQRDGSVVVNLAPGGATEEHGITFRAEVPVRGGDLRVDVSGGPISLAGIGVRDGDLGLTSTARAKLEVNVHTTWRGDGKTVAFDGTVHGTNLAVRHDKLGDDPVEGLEVAAKVKGEVQTDGTRLDLEDSEFDIGSVQLQLGGVVDRSSGRLSVDMHFGVPMVACQAVLDALPSSLIPAVKGMASAGTTSLKGRIRFDPSHPKEFLLDYVAANDCRVTAVPPAIDVARFRLPFRRMVYMPDGKQIEVETGPGTPGWLSLGAMSPFLEAAVMTTEDGGFRRHHGFDHEAIRNSVRENLIAQRFVRGASTISMQLAKNLYLGRRKTVSRKLQELILTVYLEQALTKAQILELYLNVIEFGPMVYGAGPAAHHYFKTDAGALSFGQALYLSSILPNPKLQHFGAGGRVSDGYMGFLHKLMRLAERRHWVSSADLEEGLTEWVVFGRPEPERTGTPPGEAGETKPGQDTEGGTWPDDDDAAP